MTTFALQFVVSRGANIYASPIALAWALLRIVYLQAWHGIDVLHINLAANASTYRKFIVAAVASLWAFHTSFTYIQVNSAEFWASCNRAYASSNRDALHQGRSP